MDGHSPVPVQRQCVHHKHQTARRLNLGQQYMDLCTCIKLWWHYRHDDDDDDDDDDVDDKPNGLVALE